MNTAAPASVTSPPADHIDALPVGTRLGEFELQGLLGVGGFGMVYRAFDHSLLRPVAIKEYMPAALVARVSGQALQVRTSCDTNTYQSGLASFMEEARLLAQFDHPSLVKVFRFWQANNTAYMVMPLYQGMTLKQARLHMRKPPPEAWLRKVLWAVLDALRVLHNHRTLHRDISPDNIFLQDVGPPVLLDLGAARHAIGDPSDEHTAILKVNYAPIEQYGAGTQGYAGLAQGPWSDLYSLAAVVHGCVCNDAPLPATLRAIRDRMVRFPRVAKTVHAQFGVVYSHAFVGAIARALQVQPEKRPQSIDEFLRFMAMTSAPSGLRQFDWRAELGASWADAGESLESLWEKNAQADMPTRFMDPASEGTALDLDIGSSADAAAPTAATTTASAATQEAVFVPEPLPTGPRPGQTARYQAQAARSRWMGLAVAGVLLAASAWWWLRPAPPAPAPAPVVAPAPTVGAAASLNEAKETLETAAAPPAPPTVSEALPEPAATPATRPKAARPKVQESPAPAAPAPVAPPTPAPMPVPAPEPKPVLPVRGPLEACADASFIARPMCIHNECEKPTLANHPVCVQARRQREEEEQRRRLLGQ